MHRSCPTCTPQVQHGEVIICCAYRTLLAKFPERTDFVLQARDMFSLVPERLLEVFEFIPAGAGHVVYIDSYQNTLILSCKQNMHMLHGPSQTILEVLPCMLAGIGCDMHTDSVL